MSGESPYTAPASHNVKWAIDGEFEELPGAISGYLLGRYLIIIFRSIINKFMIVSYLAVWVEHYGSSAKNS